MKNAILITLVVILVIAIIGVSIFFGATPLGRTIIKKWKESLHKADDSSSYGTQKEVENTCRAMISSYNQDKLIYEQYKDSADKSQVELANNAKIRANNTASTYNNYILKNSYVWQDNVPSDIKMKLDYIE